MSKWLSQHLNIKHLRLHLLITGKNIYPVNLLPLFIFTYCFSTLTQVTLDPSLLTFPTHFYAATYKFYLLAFSTQHRYTGNTLATTKPKNSAKLRRTSSTSVLVMGVELQVSGHRTFSSSAVESSIYYWFLNTGGFLRKKPKSHKHQSSLRLERTEFLWERGNRQRGRGITGSWSQVCLCRDVNWMDAEHLPVSNSFPTHVNRVTKINRMAEIRMSKYLLVDI